MNEISRLNRRETLSFIALSAAGGVMLPARAFARGAAEILLAQTKVCAITPQTTEGPFYFDPDLERRDITEGRPGKPTSIVMQVVDENCQPVSGAQVDIWHCDADGLYSGYVNRTQRGTENTQGETFLRGTQFADANGVVTFDTIYPGWYPGRTPHVHFKVFLDGGRELTGQMFFPDALSDRVYAETEPYRARGARDRRNANDSIARSAGTASLAEVEELPDSFTASLIVGVQPGRLG